MGKRYYVVSYMGGKDPRWVIRDASKHDAIVGKPYQTEAGAGKACEKLNMQEEESLRLFALGKEAAQAPEATQEPQEGNRYSASVGIAASQLAARQAEAREAILLQAGRLRLQAEELEKLCDPLSEQLTSAALIQAISLSQHLLYQPDVAKLARLLDRVARSEHILRTMVLRAKRNQDAAEAGGEQEETLPEELA